MAFTLKLKPYYQELSSIFKFAYRLLHIVTELYLRQPFSYIFAKANLALYLKEDYLTDFSNPKIQKLIGILTQRSKSATIAGMFEWCYGLSVDRSRTNMDWELRRASDTLELDYGVCADRAVMLVTLLRGARIPAKVVEGKWYGEPHAWVQVYYWGAWRNIDPANSAFTINGKFDRESLQPGNQEAILSWGYEIIDETVNLNSGDPFWLTWADEKWDIPFFRR